MRGHLAGNGRGKKQSRPSHERQQPGSVLREETLKALAGEEGVHALALQEATKVLAREEGVSMRREGASKAVAQGEEIDALEGQ